MADLKITQLNENTNPQGDVLIPIVTDPSGTPVTEYVTKDNFDKAGTNIWTVDLTDKLDIDLYAPRNMNISATTAIVGAPTITIEVEDAADTLGDPISAGDKITVEVTVASVVNLTFSYD
jgi:hypothetical protein